MDPIWSIVTVAYNSADRLKQYFVPPPPDFEWIVVDNASQDDSAKVAAGMGAKVIRLPRNLGFAAANNVGLANAGAAYLACVNPDVSVVYEDLRNAIQQGGSIQKGWLVAPQLLGPTGAMQPNGRGWPTLTRKVLNRAVRSGDTRGAEGGSSYRILAPEGRAIRVAWVMGAAVLARRDVWESLGGWNEAYFVYYEDHDLGLRAWRSGIDVVVDGSMQWVHGWERATSGRFDFSAWRNEAGGFLHFYSRYPALLLSENLLVDRTLRRLRPILGTRAA